MKYVIYSLLTVDRGKRMSLLFINFCSPIVLDTDWDGLKNIWAVLNMRGKFDLD